MVSSTIKKLFKNKKFIFLFTFIVELILNYLFEYQHIAGEFILIDMALAPTFGLMFGPAGALGYASATLIGELIEGINIIAIFIDFTITFFISILTYKLWYTTFNKQKIDTPRLNSTYNLIKFLSITTLVSIIYFAFLKISFEFYPTLNYTYQATQADSIAYMLNIITFSIILGLLMISCSNILRIPLQTPKKRISRINIKPNYLLLILLVCAGYFILNRFTLKSLIDHIFFLTIIITSIIFYLNTFDVTVKATNENYSIIEEIILIFLIILSVTIILNFRYFNILIDTFEHGMNSSYQFLIIITVSSLFIILVSLIHIRFIEKTITNPLYELMDTADNYFKIKNREKSFHKLKKYTKKDDSVGSLVKSFIKSYNNIKTNLARLKLTTSEKEMFKTEFDVASNIQSDMLPKNFDDFSENELFEIYAYMNPAREVGGDFYDYFRIDEDHISFVIGDVSGKGIPATLFMVKTMYLIKNHSKFNDDLSKVMEKVNNLACERNDEQLFVTCWLGKLNTKTGELSYVNAGHNKPLIKQDDNNFEFLNERPGLVLAGMEDMPYKKHVINLKPNDTLFLYTDGVTEANDNYNGFYGEDRLKEIINKNKNEKLSDIINEINKDINKFCNSSEQFDDTTMLIIKYNGAERND